MSAFIRKVHAMLGGTVQDQPATARKDPFHRTRFVWQLELALTDDRIWCTLQRRPLGRAAIIEEAWGMLRPSGELSDEYIRTAMWDACLELLSRHPRMP
jgi:hypothetical protein